MKDLNNELEEGLYTIRVSVDAKEVWCDKGVDINSNELVSIRYESGCWRVALREHFYCTEGSITVVISKEIVS